MPELSKTEEVTLEIKDSEGQLVRTFTSKKDEKFKKWDGGPQGEPTLSKSKGLNRFVWNMRYPTVPGVSGVYIETSYAGHKAVPGKYSFTVKSGGQNVTTEAEILPNPLYPTTAAAYKEYHQLMSTMEADVTTMHNLVNELYGKQKNLDSLLKSLPAGAKFDSVKKEGEALIKKMKSWDEDMIQRKSTAYDDVENFPNKFTANYMFLINATESDIPRVNQPNLDRLKELNAQWATLKARYDYISGKDIPAINKMLWDAGVGAVWEE